MDVDKRKSRRLAALWLGLALVFGGSLGAQEEPTEEERDKWEKTRAAYEKAKEKASAVGDSMSAKVPKWIQEDLKNVGTWQYRVVEVPPAEVEAKLNELGAERWECFSVEQIGKKETRLVLKKRKRSQLKELRDLSPEDLLTVIKLLGRRGEES